MPPTWLSVLAWVALAVGFASAGWILFDIYGRGYRQRMQVMEAVWPVTALYAGPLATIGYRQYGKPKTSRWLAQRDRDDPPDKPWWATVAEGVSHCGAGCTLGDIIAEFAVFFLGLTIVGETLFAEYVGDYILAIALGLAFQLLRHRPDARSLPRERAYSLPPRLTSCR